jgi:UDP:flavonoid glycosyltransferase YjiC (YdhE family)
MRVLFSVVPGPGHMFPTIPLAWALRAAGHDVLYATAADGVSAAVAAGDAFAARYRPFLAATADRAATQAAAAQVRALPPPAAQLPWIEDLAGRAQATAPPTAGARR